MDEKFLLRHRTLGLLYDCLADEPLHNIDLSKSRTTAWKLAEKMNLSEKEFHDVHMSLHGQKPEHVECFGEKGFYEIQITVHGVIAYSDDYWLTEGYKHLHDRIFYKTRWLFPLIAICASIVALAISVIALLKRP